MCVHVGVSHRDELVRGVGGGGGGGGQFIEHCCCVSGEREAQISQLSEREREREREREIYTNM